MFESGTNFSNNNKRKISNTLLKHRMIWQASISRRNVLVAWWLLSPSIVNRMPGKLTVMKTRWTTRYVIDDLKRSSGQWSPILNDHSFQLRASISLPCTLKKCKSSNDCRGSNNCYVWALDFQQLTKKTEKIEKGCPKSKTTCGNGTNVSNNPTANRESDNEFLLSNIDLGGMDSSSENSASEKEDRDRDRDRTIVNKYSGDSDDDRQAINSTQQHSSKAADGNSNWSDRPGTNIPIYLIENLKTEQEQQQQNKGETTKKIIKNKEN